MAETDVTTLPTPIPTPLNVTALAKRFGVARSTIQRRLRKGWIPPATVQRKPPRKVAARDAPLVPHEVPHPLPQPLQPMPQPVEHHGGSRKMGAVLLATASAIAVLAVSINAQTGWRFGTTQLASMTFAGLSVAADVLGIVLPSAAVALWWRGDLALSTSAWATWCLAASMATLASVGFASLHISDTAAGRAAVVSTATEMTNQRSAAIDAAKVAADAASKARQAECQRRGQKCRELEHAEQVRMSELAAAIAVPVPTAATIQDADPQVTGAVKLAQWAGLGVTATDIGNLRLVLMALLPNLAGLVMAFGAALRR